MKNETRARVAHYASLGLPEQQIAQLLGLDLQYVTRFYAEELSFGPIAPAQAGTNSSKKPFWNPLPLPEGLIVTRPNGERDPRDM